MKNPNIATVLKYYRKLNHLSVNEVSDILKEQNNLTTCVIQNIQLLGRKRR